MTLDKFGSHILSKYGKNGDSLTSQNGGTTNLVNISNVKLFYNVVLPFVGKFSSNDKNFLLGGEINRTSYKFPFEFGTILSGEYPKKEISLLVNGKGGKLEGRKLKKDDLIAFRRDLKSTLTKFYGELIIKCPIIIE